MQRITISIDDDLMEEIDNIIKKKNYQNRSEAIRDLARAGIQHSSSAVEGNPPCVGARAPRSRQLYGSVDAKRRSRSG